MGVIVPLLDSRTATGGEGSARLSGDRHSNNKLFVTRRVEFDFARQPSTARLQKIESRPEKPAASRNAGTLMPGIMYLQMRNGLANSFPDHFSDRPNRRRALQVLGPRGPKNPIRMPLRTDTVVEH